MPRSNFSDKFDVAMGARFHRELSLWYQGVLSSPFVIRRRSLSEIIVHSKNILSELAKRGYPEQLEHQSKEFLRRTENLSNFMYKIY